MRVGSIFSIHISSVPLQGIFRVVEGLQEELQNLRCDLYFYRQVKNYVAEFENCPGVAAVMHELSIREDCIKIHALIHNK